jgi:hypothetical protein
VENGIQEKSSQMSLVFDYDFTSGTQVSVTTRELGLNPVDLSGLQYIEVYYMLAGESSTDSVNFYLDAGSINEDSDGDGILDKEDSNSDGVMQTGEDRGYAFNGNNATVVGSGPGLSSYTSGDGVLNSEDLNGNGTLDTTESTIAFPGSSTPPASIAMSDTAGTWKKARIYVDVTQLSQSQINQLKETEAVRLTLEQASAQGTPLHRQAAIRIVEVEGRADGRSDRRTNTPGGHLSEQHKRRRVQGRGLSLQAEGAV